LNHAKERTCMKASRLILVALTVLALGSCNLLINLFGGPQVALYAPKTVLGSGEIVTLEANVTGASGLLSYKWYENGVDLLVYTSQYSYSKFVTSSQDVTIKVDVTDGNGRTTTDSVVLTVVRPTTYATIHIVNSWTYDIYYLYISPASSGDWGPDQLRPSYKIYASGGSWDVSGVPSGSWDLMAVSISSLYTWTALNQSVTPGTYTWTLTSSNHD
jgi:hypothetical protein